MSNIKQCECGANIFFMKAKPSNNNPFPKPNPINELPDPNGNLLVRFGLDYYEIVPKKELEKNKLLPNPQVLYISHFATCPQKTKHRKK